MTWTDRPLETMGWFWFWQSGLQPTLVFLWRVATDEAGRHWRCRWIDEYYGELRYAWLDDMPPGRWAGPVITPE